MSAEPRIVETALDFVRKNLLVVAATLALVVVAGGVVWTMNCPCEGTPGFVLLGDTQEEPVADWSFANDVSLCAIQIGIWLRPHSVNVNCMATPEGDLFISCSVGANKYWCPRVGQDHSGRLRLDGVVYPVVLNREMDPAMLDHVWAARIPEAAEAGSAGAAARRRWRAAAARYPAAGELVDVPCRVAFVTPGRSRFAATASSANGRR